MGIFQFGPTGRHISVDASGRIIANSNAASAPFIFGYGKTGNPISVDASGRLLIADVSGGGGGGGGTDLDADVGTSGFTLVGTLAQPVSYMDIMNDEIYAVARSWFGATSGQMFRFTVDSDLTYTLVDTHYPASGAGKINGDFLTCYNGKVYWSYETQSDIYQYDPTTSGSVSLGIIASGDVAGNAGVTAIGGATSFNGRLHFTPRTHTQNTSTSGILGQCELWSWDGISTPLIDNVVLEGYLRGVPGGWGWLIDPVVIDGQLFATYQLSEGFTTWDGAANTHYLSADMMPVLSRIQTIMEHNGRTFFTSASGIHEFTYNSVTPESGSFSANLIQSFVEASGVPFNDGSVIHKGATYNGRAWMAFKNGSVIRSDNTGDTWEVINTFHTFPVGFMTTNGVLVCVLNDGSVFARREDISPTRGLENYSKVRSNSKISPIFQRVIYSHIGISGTDSATVNQNLAPTDYVNQYPNYSNTFVATQSGNFGQTIGELDSRVQGLSKEQTVTVSGVDTIIDLSLGSFVNLDLNGSGTFVVLSNPTEGAKYKFFVKQDGGASGTATWPFDVKWQNGVAPTLSTPSGTVDIISMNRSNANDSYYATFQSGSWSPVVTSLTVGLTVDQTFPSGDARTNDYPDNSSERFDDVTFEMTVRSTDYLNASGYVWHVGESLGNAIYYDGSKWLLEGYFNNTDDTTGSADANWSANGEEKTLVFAAQASTSGWKFWVNDTLEASGVLSTSGWLGLLESMAYGGSHSTETISIIAGGFEGSMSGMETVSDLKVYLGELPSAY